MDMKYISDSGGRDIVKTLNDITLDNVSGGLHLLIHPIWWVEKAPDPTQTLNQWKRWNNLFIQSEIRANCKTYKD
jgi:hypothetical protein